MTNDAHDSTPFGRDAMPDQTDGDWFWSREAAQGAAPADGAGAGVPAEQGISTGGSVPAEQGAPSSASDDTQVIPGWEQTRELPVVDQTQVLAASEFAAHQPEAAAQTEPTAQQGTVPLPDSDPQQWAPPTGSPEGWAPPTGSPEGWAPPVGHPWQATGQLGADGLPVTPWSNSAYPNASFPTTQAPTQQASRRSSGRALVAVFTVGALVGAAMLQAPALMTQSGSSTPSSSSAPGGSQRERAQQEQAGQGQTGQGQTSQGQAGQGQTGQGSETDPVPAEQDPWDPWDSWGEQGSNSQAGSASPQTRATGSQSKGVVLISTRSASGRSAGTGMVVSSDGQVLTNYHVVQQSTEVEVEIAATGATHTAHVVGHDASNDVALLQIDGVSGLDTVTLDEDGLSSGDQVTAVGNSNGQGFLSAAEGTVTSMSSSITVSNQSSASGQERLVDVIRTTAGAEPGDSGGPMYDVQGEVVGMTTAGQKASSGINTENPTVASFAVPIERAMSIVERIQQGSEGGTVKVGPKAYLGVSVRQLDDGSLGVASVVEDGPAAQAGVEAGDVLVGIAGSAIESQAQLSDALAGREPGDKVEIAWLDGQGESRSASLTLGESPVN